MDRLEQVGLFGEDREARRAAPDGEVGWRRPTLEAPPWTEGP